jgi:AraC family transcriptional regulator of adaptative response / DNA-3-methyladenine glycosylase II
VARHGEPLDVADGALTYVFQSAAAVAEADDAVLAMPARRRETLRGLCAALRDGDLDLGPGADRTRARRDLLALPGIGPWTVEYVAMRALRDPDAFPAGDLGVRHALERLGQDARPVAAERLAARWRPYRASAVQHLWASLGAEAAAPERRAAA